MKIMYGKVIADIIKENVKNRVEAYYKKYNLKPTLATIIVGNDPSSIMYVKMKIKACLDVGIEPKKIELPADTCEKDLIALIKELNTDKTISGILVQHPLPKHIDEEQVFSFIDPSKDVDGLNPISYGKIAMGMDGYLSATPAAVLEMLKYYKIPASGKNVVIIGRSPILGKPLAAALLNEDATVTICHSKTENLKLYLENADLIVGALGKAKYIPTNNLKKDVVLIDAGYNEGNVGDIDINENTKCSAYTPVPGGLGPVTIAKLLEQTLDAFEKQNKIR